MKVIGMRIRVKPSLRRALLIKCRTNDRTVPEAFRAFMRDYIAHKTPQSNTA